jgi:VIT1/CCC1 family predicted Fe2+/Mn2+ transporter
MAHVEHHYLHRGSWLRAAVLGANDGIVSTASLVLGVAAADADARGILTAGLAGLVGGALSMAAGEFVSVSSQKDVEDADLDRERAALRETPEEELEELAAIYVEKGLPAGLARQVAEKTAHLERALAELQASHAQLAQAERLAALGTLAGGVAHEFHNVIGGIRGCAHELLADETEELTVATDAAAKSTEAAAKTHDDLTAALRASAKG